MLFLTGGASTQFFMLPANLLPEGSTADYLVTGAWSEKAVAEAKRYGRVHEAASTAATNHDRIPRASEIRWSERPLYAHFTSNNTIFGTQWTSEPAPPPGVWLACDASSDIFSRPSDLTRYGVVYAGAQKTIGPAGVTLVIARRDLLERPVRELPTMLRYATHLKDGLDGPQSLTPCRGGDAGQGAPSPRAALGRPRGATRGPPRRLAGAGRRYLRAIAGRRARLRGGA